MPLCEIKKQKAGRFQQFVSKHLNWILEMVIFKYIPILCHLGFRHNSEFQMYGDFFYIWCNHSLNNFLIDLDWKIFQTLKNIIYLRHPFYSCSNLIYSSKVLVPLSYPRILFIIVILNSLLKFFETKFLENPPESKIIWNIFQPYFWTKSSHK